MQFAEDAYEPDDDFVNGDLPNFRLQSTAFDVEDGEQSSLESAQEYKYNLPEVVKNFIIYLFRQIKEQNVHEIHNLYENSFNKLTDKLFKASPWPSVDAVKTLVDPERDSVFLMLYKELYYRHIYAKLTPTVEQRVESWNNYCDLFSYLLNATSPAEVELDLPNQWLWDITDEFIYQFQAFSQYRSKLKNKSADELVVLRAHPEVWNVDGVLSYLSALIAKSQIINSLQSEKQSSEERSLATFSGHPVYRTLGYFSIIGQLRVQCLLGDYYLGLKTLIPIDLNRKGFYTRVTACHITLYYYLGFSYLMMRRYVDAIKALSNILLYINRTKQYHTRSYQYEQIVKKHDQMYTLLAIAVSLCPQRIDETVHAVLRDKYVDKMIKMQRGDESVFDELFSFACPKFITPAAPDYDEETPRPQHQIMTRRHHRITTKTRICFNSSCSCWMFVSKCNYQLFAAI
jgi:translation initiation factor 3 subunit L